MANGEQVQGGQQTGGGQRTYSEEDVMALMNEAARRAATEAVKRKVHEDDDDDTAVSVINPKVVKQLKDTVAVFTALKELSSNPLQKTIEETVGGMAASVVQSAFAPRGPPPKQDIIDKMLNSQFAFGLGSGLGQRAPELVETMGRTFGTDKAGQMMDNIIGKYGGQGGQSRQLSPSSPSSHSSPSGPSSSSSGSSTPSSTSEQKSDKQSEKELLLSLDPNNPEHVSAYAETQGGLPVDVARKMLMIHQDAFIEQLKRDGMNVDQISTQRGSRTQPNPPVQQPAPVQQTPPIQPISPSPIRQDVPPTSPTYPSGYPNTPMEQPSSQSIGNNTGNTGNIDNTDNIDNIEYAEYDDVVRPGQAYGSQLGQQPGPQPVPQNNLDNQQVEMMKTFATDIGKVMGEMLNKIETLNNTVFTLQSEMNDVKKQSSRQPTPVHTEMPPRVSPYVIEYPPDMVGEDIVRTPSDITPPEITRERIPFDTPSFGAPSLETFEDQIIDSPKDELDIERSEDFFEENIIDISDFQQELEKEAKLESEKLKQNAPSPEPVVQPIPPPVAQPTPPMVVQHVPSPVAQMIKPVQPTIVDIQPTIQPLTQPSQSPITQTLPSIEAPVPIKENIPDIPKTEDKNINELNNILAIRDNIISENKDDNENKGDNKFVIPIKKTGIHKKATYKNLAPSFKKSDDKENKEENRKESNI